MVLMKTYNVWHEFGRGSPHMSAHVLQRFGVPPPIVVTFATGACPVPAHSDAAGYTVDGVSVRRFDGNGKARRYDGRLSLSIAVTLAALLGTWGCTVTELPGNRFTYVFAREGRGRLLWADRDG